MLYGNFEFTLLSFHGGKEHVSGEVICVSSHHVSKGGLRIANLSLSHIRLRQSQIRWQVLRIQQFYSSPGGSGLGVVTLQPKPLTHKLRDSRRFGLGRIV